MSNSSKPDPAVAIGEADTSVSLTSFGTIMDTFFIGLLLTGSSELQISLRVPLAYLFLSLFGFLYSTLIYANASGEAARSELESKGEYLDRFDRQMDLANTLSEYWGFYFAAFAFPLVILGYSPDRMLAIVVLIAHVIGFTIYHMSGYSILERNFNRQNSMIIFLLLLSVHVISFITFFSNSIRLFYFTSGILIISTLLVHAGSVRLNETFSIGGE